MGNVWYFILVSSCVTGFYGLYVVFFKNTTFFTVNRIYLSACLIFSFLIPVLNLSIAPVDYHLTATQLIEGSSFPVFDTASQVTEPVSSPYKVSFIPIVYWIGFALMMSRLLFSMTHVMRIRKNATIHWNGKLKTWRADSIQPFCFFNQIFLPKYDVSPLVVDHESAHVKLLHWVDLLLVETASALLWFNPIMILYRRSVKIQHEYEADAHVIRKSGLLEEYLSCILHHLQASNPIGPISQFYTVNIKTRILMMTKKKTSLKFSLLYLLCIPAGCMLLLSFSNPSERTITFTNSSNFADDGNVVIIVDAGHGGHDTGAKSSDGMSEKEVVLSVAKSIQREGEANNIKVILTRNGDEPLTLDERVLMTKRYQADAFISLHTNFDKNTSNAGIECFVSEKSIRFDESKRLADNLLHELQTLQGISVNGIMKSDFHVLRGNTIPAILLELGYLSNARDYQYVTNQDNQKSISKSIIAAVIKYTK
jgi:N-acetylmuramoyl-L-alanine amidase